MESFRVSWKVKNTSSSAKDAQHSSTVSANSKKEAIEKVKANNPATRDRMYSFKVEKI